MAKDYIKQINPESERRFMAMPFQIVQNIEKREDGDVPTTVTAKGYAALFDSETDMGWYMEVIEKGFFDDVLNDDVRCLFNHDQNMVLGRSSSGAKTCRVGVDDKGLWFEVDLDPEISYHEDLINSMKRGDVDQCSFAFTSKETAWVERGNDPSLRKLIKCEQLYDVSVVTYPAYTDTSVALRSKPQPEEVDNSAIYARITLAKNKQSIK